MARGVLFMTLKATRTSSSDARMAGASSETGMAGGFTLYDVESDEGVVF